MLECNGMLQIAIVLIKRFNRFVIVIQDVFASQVL